MKKRELIFATGILLAVSIFVLLKSSFRYNSFQEEMGDTVYAESSDEEKNDTNEISDNDVGEPTEETEDKDTFEQSLSVSENENIADRGEEEYKLYIDQELQLSDEQYETFIDFPQLSGMEDKEREKRLNALIEKDVMRILEYDDPDDEWCFSAILHYEIKYTNNRIISILYKGSYGAIVPGRGQPATAMVTTIDMEEEKILILEDVVVDFNLLHEMLMADRFENITKWDGEAGQYKISEEYSNAERLMKELNGSDEDIEWYIDNGHFVIVIFDGDTDYNEYAIGLQDAKDFLRKDFWEKIN